jgi:Predicted glycosyltransferases
MAKLGIVIVNYNGEKYQNDCIRSLYSMNYQNFEIIVVDSASKDQSIALLKKEFPNVHILEEHDNVGVAVGNNIGIRYSVSLNTEYTLLLNNDVELHSELISELLQKADSDTIVVPKIYYYEPNNLLWFAGGKLLWNKGSAMHVGIHEEDRGQYDKEILITYAPTCCMLIHNRIFERIGMIDEKMFMYYDDTDLCARMQENGIRLLYVPTAKMWHKVSSSSGGENSKLNVYYMFRNQLYFMKKHKNMLIFPARLYALSRAGAKYLLSPFRCKNDKYILEAYKDYFVGKMGRKDFG